MDQIWFLYSGNVVTGPFSTDEVRTKVSSGEINEKTAIWWRGQREWVSVAHWESNLPKLLKAQAERHQKPVWYINTGGPFNVGPLTRSELIDNLKATSELNHVKLWAIGMDNWVGLFELHDVVEDLGISRREHERVPLMGTVAINRSNDSPKGFVVKPTSISATGLGITGSHDLRRGDEVGLLIKSPDLGANLHLRGEVVYVTAGGYAGVRFIKVPAEAEKQILDLVQRFKSGAKAA